ncbi:CheR family methyltransferase [Segetibacter aerophilus]|uniref:Chemotaxis protein CheR n=1 Tax=Segetibacter aerophilus TaxID=670293 RepID=A0A512B7N5_9BACT|nr:protein-glutamate O-methyltransferase CheR [Segetibacter aerophilus]GEO07970.1 chemotaxis protein CheR [Segetibacter aerophilus]
MSERTSDISDEEIEEILHLVYHQYGYDFTNYSRASMQRRITRFIDSSGYRNIDNLKKHLGNDKSVFDLFLQKITVNVTEMFRDPEFYKVIRTQIIPAIASYPTIKIWHAGCSSGEEVFSMAILLHEAGLLNRSKIYATDINPHNIEKAKIGILPLDVMKEYVANYIQAGGERDFASYYTAGYDHAIIRKDLRSNIVFSQHNLVTDQVFNEFQLIFCRNVMIYFNRALQNKIIHLFYNSLSTFGYLALGIKESLLFSDLKSKFDVVSSQEKIFRRTR